MSANLDLVKSIYAAFERGDYSSIEWAHPEIEFVIAEGPTPDSWTGVAGMAEGWRDVLSAWCDARSDVDEYRELDDERVLVLFRDDDYRNWRKRRYVPAARAAGLESPRPYDLRHSQHHPHKKGRITGLQPRRSKRARHTALTPASTNKRARSVQPTGPPPSHQSWLPIPPGLPPGSCATRLRRQLSASLRVPAFGP